MGDDGRSQAAVEPGQIWLIEQVAGAAICPFDRDALTSANVVVYDRALASLVARTLPLGGYAEPLSHDVRAEGSAVSRRALDFAAAGWSVAQLVEARPGCHERLRGAVAALRPVVDAGALPPIRVIAKGGAAGPPPSREASMQSLPGLIDEFACEDPLTLVFGPLTSRHPAGGQVFTANGLAG
jgi:hypothetical protein